MNPYRSPAIPVHVSSEPVHPAWKRYSRHALAYNLLLWSSVLFLAGLVVFEPLAAIIALPLLPLPLFVVWLGVRDCACPCCGESIVDDPLVSSYARYFAGLFPRNCTQCWAEVPEGPVQPECECPKCRKR